jgi:hypothetical protein
MNVGDFMYHRSNQAHATGVIQDLQSVIPGPCIKKTGLPEQCQSGGATEAFLKEIQVADG